MPNDHDSKPTCFIAMPITVHTDEAELYGDVEHWSHVMKHLFIPAIEKAGYRAIEPSAAGTSMIHGRIVRQLSETDLVLCDLSRHNPNVLFELGVRTSLNKPIALVKDEYLGLPFDIQGLNTHKYSSKLSPWTLEQEVDDLAKHIRETAANSGTTNPLWEHFGVAIAASSPTITASPEDAKLQLILERIESMEKRPERKQYRLPAGFEVEDSRDSQIGHMILQVPGTESVSNDPTDDGFNITVRTRKSTATEQRQRAVEIVKTLAGLGHGVSLENTGPSSIELVTTDPRPEWGEAVARRVMKVNGDGRSRPASNARGEEDTPK